MKPTSEETETIERLLADYPAGHMRPDIYSGRYSDIDTYFEPVITPQDPCQDIAPECQRNGILVRLSAPGYLDCTDWVPMRNWAEVIEWLENEVFEAKGE